MIYLLKADALPVTPQMGLIINKSVGGSVTRHRIARHLRHAMASYINMLPDHTQIVIRVLRNSVDYRSDLEELLSKALKRIDVQA